MNVGDGEKVFCWVGRCLQPNKTGKQNRPKFSAFFVGLYRNISTKLEYTYFLEISS